MTYQLRALRRQLAGDYLAEQRAKADPRLQQAIDRIWKRILAEDR